VENSYDATFKILVDHSPRDWARYLSSASVEIAAPVDTTLHETKEVVDRLLRVEHLGCEFILHVEFHAGHSGNAIPSRLFHYNAAVMKRHALTTLSCVLILRKEADSPSISGGFVRTIEPFGDIHSFRYHPIRLWKEPFDRFLIPGSSLAVAGVLADFGERTLEEAGAEIRRCIDEVSDPDGREDMLYHLVVLAGMRFNRNQAESIFGRNVSVLEKYSVTLQYFIREGEERGQRNLLLASARQLFGTPTQQIIEKVNEATSEKLLTWTVRLRTAQSWNELITD
jgi:predicted transposase YdaD